MSSYGSGPGDVLAQVSIDGPTDTVNGASLVGTTVTTAKRKYRLALAAQVTGAVDAIHPIAYTNATAAAGREVRVSFVSAGVYDVEIVDSTGAAADATGQIVVTFLRGPRLG